jgi:hypothetical protein
MYDGSRRAVSDFVMGKSNITDIVAGENNNINDILEKLESIELKLTDRR